MLQEKALFSHEKPLKTKVVLKIEYRLGPISTSTVLNLPKNLLKCTYKQLFRSNFGKKTRFCMLLEAFRTKWLVASMVAWDPCLVHFYSRSLLLIFTHFSLFKELVPTLSDLVPRVFYPSTSDCYDPQMSTYIVFSSPQSKMDWLVCSF